MDHSAAEPTAPQPAADLEVVAALRAMLGRLHHHAERGDRERFIMGLSLLSGEAARRFEVARQELRA